MCKRGKKVKTEQMSFVSDFEHVSVELFSNCIEMCF